MLKETPRSLRQYFSLVAILSSFPLVFNVARGGYSTLLTPFALLNFASFAAFAYIVIRFYSLLPNPKFIQAVLGVGGIWTLIGFAFSLRRGVDTRAVVVVVISLLVMVYLMKSVTRLSREATQKNA
jgi:hypothetical protein